ncbi:hypothetical protein EDD86DRAFT_202038 [Gorgonomyces haynaldii]|nr:hypothetical protein EDD86DRAFT_202038 [Gorgonomyces haynaldii]
MIENEQKQETKPYRPFKQIEGWTVPGPKAKYEMMDTTVAPSNGEMLTALSGHWMIYQLEFGHRMTTDDVLGGYVAIEHMKALKPPKKYLDLGTGLGSVLNLVNWAFHDSIEKSVGVEAQLLHVNLARKTLEFNGISDKVQIVHQDLRHLIEEDCLYDTFDLITGTPPYFNITDGTLPHDIGRGMCAFEIRGGVEVYVDVGVKYLASDESRLIIVNTSLEIRRTVCYAQSKGLFLLEQLDVHGKEGKPSLFTVFVFGRSEQAPKRSHLNVRDLNGQHTPEMDLVHKTIGKPPVRFEPASCPK